MLVTLEIRDQAALKGLAKLKAGLAAKSSLLNTIGEYLTESTRKRIRAGGPVPDGTPWAPLAPLTLDLKKNKDHGILWDSGMLIHPESIHRGPETIDQEFVLHQVQDADLEGTELGVQ